MTQYPVAWSIVIVAGLLLSGCIFFAVRHKPVRYLLTTLATVWMLMPWRFDDDPGHFAPAFIVLLFSAVFERDGNPAPVLMGYAVVTTAVLAPFLAVYAFRVIRKPRG